MKKNKIKRLISIILDIYIPFILLVKFIVAPIALSLDKTFLNSIYGIIPITILIIIVAIILKYVLINKEQLFRGRSIGQIICGLYIVNQDGEIIKDPKKLIERNKLILKNPFFNIYKLVFYNETEDQTKLKTYIVSKEQINKKS